MTRLGFCTVLCVVLGSFAAAADPTTLVVVARDPLPGFRRDAVAPYIATRMESTYLANWHFIAGADGPDRIEWRFVQQPFAGGAVRQYFPQAEVQRLFGPRRLISAEVRLYRGAQYQAMLSGQAIVQGGASDPDLSDLVKHLTEQMLGPGGALDAIEAGSRR